MVSKRGSKGINRANKDKDQGMALATMKDLDLKNLTRDQARDIMRARINTQNPSTIEVEMLRAAMKLLPAVTETVGNLALQARELTIDKMSGNDMVREAVRLSVEKVHRDLGYESAPAIERLVIEQIGMCWLLMYETHQRYTSARASTTSMSIDQAVWLEKRLSMVQARYLKSIEMLARVRKLAKPSHTLMLNVAKQQINAAIGIPEPQT